ncbi:unnamed protein product [Schistocephalus solidus]|uniref:Piezo_RRas_bdg domain-containing protein n=1 Tax=Schistocephalus solidus TaxID=70667 RepID=A0A183SNX3_SCHSO|nr:unnamed protein product [Schistocephalus solidus]
MPGVQITLIGGLPLVFVSLYFLGRLIWQQISRKSVKPSLAAAHLLTGTGTIWNHPVFIALACSRIYAPNLLMEALYNGALQTICLFFVRLASVLLCLALWNHLYKTGHSNVNEYVKCRYRSSWINLLYNINTIFGFSYLMKLESGPTGYAFVDFLVADRLISFSIIFWLILTSLGGFETTMVAVVVIWVLEILGHLSAAVKIPKLQFVERAVDDLSVNICLTNLGLPSFVIIFFQMMTVLPFYRLYRTAGTRTKANFAIALSIGIFAFDQFWALLEASTIHSLSLENKIAHQYRIRAMIGGLAQSGKMDAKKIKWQGIESQNISVYTSKLWDLNTLGGLFLFGPVIGHYKAYLIIQLHLMTCHVLEHLLPRWLAEGLFTSYPELRVLYTCIRMLLSTFVFIQLTRAIYTIGNANFRGILFYLPLLPSILTLTVGTFLVLGLMQKILKATIVVPMTAIQLLVSVFVLGLFSWSSNEEDFVTQSRIWSQGFQSMPSGWMCGVAWFPTMLASFFAFFMMTLARMLQVPSTDALEVTEEGKEKEAEEAEEAAGFNDDDIEVNGDRGLAGSVGDFTADP